MKWTIDWRLRMVYYTNKVCQVYGWVRLFVDLCWSFGSLPYMASGGALIKRCSLIVFAHIRSDNVLLMFLCLSILLFVCNLSRLNTSAYIFVILLAFIFLVFSLKLSKSWSNLCKVGQVEAFQVWPLFVNFLLLISKLKFNIEQTQLETSWSSCNVQISAKAWSGSPLKFVWPPWTYLVKLHYNPYITFWLMLLENRQTEKRHQKHNLHVRDNNVFIGILFRHVYVYWNLQGVSC